MSTRPIELPTFCKLIGEPDELGNMIAYVKSATRPGLWHTVAITPSGEVMCECEDHHFRVAPRAKPRLPRIDDECVCKHVDTFRYQIFCHWIELFGCLGRAA